MIRILLPALRTEPADGGPAGVSTPVWSLPERTVELDEAEVRHLVHAAREAAVRAYAPFSRFHVGAALVMDDDPAGATITGANVENGSYGLTNCAERTALHQAAARGFRRLRLLAVSCPEAPAAAIEHRAPCGACRQVILEFACERTLVLLDRGDDTFSADVLDPDRLLPFGFRLDSRRR